jgi:hypothetical protein
VWVQVGDVGVTGSDRRRVLLARRSGTDVACPLRRGATCEPMGSAVVIADQGDGWWTGPDSVACEVCWKRPGTIPGFPGRYWLLRLSSPMYERLVIASFEYILVMTPDTTWRQVARSGSGAFPCTRCFAGSRLVNTSRSMATCSLALRPASFALAELTDRTGLTGGIEQVDPRHREIQHLVAVLLARPAADPAHRLRWSVWRRRRQARARTCRYHRQANGP